MTFPILKLNHSLSVIKSFIWLIALLLLLVTTQNAAIAAANLMVTPTRVVFDEKTRTTQVSLINNGSETGSFRIAFIRQNMTEDGQFVKVKDDEKGNFADPMIRYSPRQVTLPPGQSQVIRLMLRKPRDLEDGEYRSHMLFQSLPKPSKSSLESTLGEKSDNITVEIIPIVGISIPVIVRKGSLSYESTLSDAELIPGNKKSPSVRLGVDIHRTGESSVYGDLRATYIPKDGLPTVIGLAKGVAVYTPNAIRHYEIPLVTQPGLKITDGTIRIVYLEPGKNEEKGLIAETSFALK